MYLQCRNRARSMLTKVQKWDNRLAICIPKELADEIGLEVGSEVELRVGNRRLEVFPLGAPRYTLEELAAQITPENQHSEIDWGPAVGKEVW